MGAGRASAMGRMNSSAFQRGAGISWLVLKS
jgi:hypothetical protein